jgi:hypothetical protein
LERKKKVSQTVPVQSIIDRSLYIDLVKLCAETDTSIKEVLKVQIEDLIKNDKFATREWKMSDEQYRKGISAYETYLNIRDEIESLQKGEKSVATNKN